MSKPNKIKEYGSHFRVFSLYLKLDYEECQNEMKAFLRALPNTGLIKNSDKKVEGWWNEGRKPQDDQIVVLNEFFKGLAQQRELVWRDDWIKQPLSVLKKAEAKKGKEKSGLQIAVEKFEEPNAKARLFKESYEHSHLLEKVIEFYCHKCFFIYRVHTGNGQLVRDLLRIQGHDEEKIFCTLYQYSSHDPDFLKWENIKTFKGNMFFNNASLDITFASERYSSEQGAQYGNIVCPRFFENSERLGILMALTDQSHHPAAAAILIRRTQIKSPFDMNKIKFYVKEILPNELDDYQEIMAMIDGKRIVIEQPEKGISVVKIPTNKER